MESYVVGFRIFDGRSLQTEDGNPCDPFVVVTCCGHRWQSVTMENKGPFVPWNEGIIWPSVDLHPKEFESASIDFKVYARNWFTRNYLIGHASLQLCFVNARRHHVYAKRWLQLRREDSTAVTGMINISVFVLRPGQVAPTTTQQSCPEADDNDDARADTEDWQDLRKAVLNSKVDAPVGKASYIKIDIHRVDELRDLPAHLPFPGGSPSPYVTVEFAGALLWTEVAPSVKEYTFNARMQIPVVTPIYEDTIIVKLWSRSWFSSDELLAQGLLSFTELRNVGLKPRWFSLYGWNLEEIPDLEEITDSGVTIEPNYFMGRLLLSGRVERLEEDEDLQPAAVMAAQTIQEPTTEQLVLLADVYMVVGAKGSRCRVEISYGCTSETTDWAACQAESADDQMAKIEKSRDQPEEDELNPGEAEGSHVFQFDERGGRITPLVVITPTDPISQSKVMVSVYTEGVLQPAQRVGTQLFLLSDFEKYDVSTPAKARFLALNSMPNSLGSSTPPSVLMTLERHNTDAMHRSQRKPYKPMIYLVRAYCFMARNIAWEGGSQSSAQPDDFSLRVSCGGMFKTTSPKAGPRPLWMEPVDLKVILFSHSTKETPSIEPITVTLARGGSLGSQDIGRAMCQYHQMRKQDSVGKWLPFRLRPQWVQVYGGRCNKRHTGEVLVAFELMLWKNHDELKLQPQSMWPVLKDRYDPRRDFCPLRKATLHFSLYGLRDLLPLPRLESMGAYAGSVDVTNPRVEVEIASFLSQPLHGSSRCNEKLVFHFRQVTRHGDRRQKADQMKQWKSRMGQAGAQEGMNFEMLQVQKMRCVIPESGVLEPYITVRVLEMPKGSWFGSEATLGEARLSLARYLPCCWLEGVRLDQPFAKQEPDIRAQLEKSEERMSARSFWQDEDPEVADGGGHCPAASEPRLQPRLQRACTSHTRTSVIEPIEPTPEKEENLNDTGLPLLLRRSLCGFQERDCKKPLLSALRSPNMQVESPFSPRDGEKGHQVGKGNQDEVHGKLEEERPCEFPFKNIPLLRNHDVFTKEDRAKDWNFRRGLVFGFVKCAFKLVDGWEEDGDGDEWDMCVQPRRTFESEVKVDGEDIPRLKRSYPVDAKLNSYAFDEEKLQKHFKGEEGVVRITVQLALVKAVCIFSKGGSGSGYANPYIEFLLGRKHHVQMRNMAVHENNCPEFWRVESRQIELPEDGRLEVSIMHLEDMAFSDTLVGSTVLDLEDRWYSRYGSQASVPKEKRSLFSAEHADKVRGNLEMWVTMFDSTTEVERIFLQRPPPVELEIRFVVWTASKVRALPGYDYVNVKLCFALNCKEFFGDEHVQQWTDVHQNAPEGNAVFNWRVVYRRIKMPTDECSLTVSLYHHETLGETFMGSLNLDLKKHLERVQKDGDPVTTLPVDISFMDNDYSSDDDDIGTVNMEMCILTQGEANARRVGLGREEPNIDPQLITPEGRGWDAYLSTFSIPWPDLELWKKAIPLILAGLTLLATLVLLKYLGLV